MNIEGVAVDSIAHEEKKNNSVFRNIINLFFSPSEVSESLRTRPRWLVPFIICTLFSITFSIMTWDILLEDKIKDVQSNQALSAEEIGRRVDNLRMQQQGDLTNMHIPSFLIGISLITASQALKLFGLSFVIWLALHLSAPKIQFKGILSVCSFSMLVIVVEIIFRTPLILLKNSMKIYIGLAAFLPARWESSPLFNLLEKLDFFSIWIVLLLMISIPIVTGISRKKAAFTIGYLWAIWLLFSMFFGNLIQIV